MWVGRAQLHDRVDAAVEIGAVGLQGVVSESVTSLADRNSAKHNAFHCRSEDVVAGVNGAWECAQLAGQTDLPVLGVSLLGARKPASDETLEPCNSRFGRRLWGDNQDKTQRQSR